MKNEELKKEITDEKTGISYTLIGDYYIPNLTIPKHEKITLNKYGRLRLNYLKEYKKAEYTMLLVENKLYSHLKEIQEIAEKNVNDLIKQLKEKSNLTEDMKNTNPMYWVGTMNAIKNQAEEIVLKDLLYI